MKMSLIIWMGDVLMMSLLLVAGLLKRTRSNPVIGEETSEMR